VKTICFCLLLSVLSITVYSGYPGASEGIARSADDSRSLADFSEYVHLHRTWNEGIPGRTAAESNACPE
jgi:hypothetical protein